MSSDPARDPRAGDGVAGDAVELPIRDRIVALLTPASESAGAGQRSRGLTAAELADLLDRHITTVRQHLERLIQAGVVASYDLPVPVGRPRRCYTLAQAPTVPADFYRVLGEIFADAVTPEVGPEEAGRRWAYQHAIAQPGGGTPQPARTPGEWMAKLGPLADSLQQWGYAPSVEIDPGGFCAKVTLGACPVMGLVERSPGPVCAAHRGMIRGTLEAAGELAEVELTIAPTSCVALVTAISPPVTGPPPRQPQSDHTTTRPTTQERHA